MCKQRSCVTRIREGDRNTQFFHRRATWRQKKNTISKLKKDNGEWCEDIKEIQNMATSFFKNLYTKDDGVNPQVLLDLIQEKVSSDINACLTKEFTEQEISDALFQIGPLNAPGLDGFPARFFQRNWETLKQDVVNAVMKFFEDGMLPEGVNDTFIVFIPKGNNPKCLKDFRPISLCNVIYKVISKCLVNQLRLFLDDLISETKVHSSLAG